MADEATTTTAAPAAQPAAQVQAPAQAPAQQQQVAPTADAGKQPAKTSEPYKLPENLKKLSDDPDFFNKQTRERTISMLRAAGLKIPRKVREGGSLEQVLQAASERVGTYKGARKELARMREEVAKLAQENSTLQVYADSELTAMSKEQAAAIKQSVGVPVDKEVPAAKAHEVLRAIAMARRLGVGQGQASTAQPQTAQTAEKVPAQSAEKTPQAATQAAQDASSKQVAPLQAPQATAPQGSAPPPTQANGTQPTVREQYQQLRRIVEQNPDDRKARLMASTFAMQHARELSHSYPNQTNPAGQPLPR